MTLAINIREQPCQIFIGEALELSRQIEEGLLNLLQDHSPCKIHNLVRAAHSLKGGAAQVNLTGIQKLAYRLEKSFSALRQKNVEINSELVQLLTQGYEFLRLQVLAEIEENDRFAADTLAKAEPVFALLEDKLGQNSMDEAELPTAAELGVDLKRFILTTEVSLALEDLENTLANYETEELAEEIKIQLEVVLGFGEFLELCEFVEIAENTIAALHINPEAAQRIGKQASIDLRAAWQEALARSLPTNFLAEEIIDTDEDEKLVSIPSLEDIFDDFVPSREHNFYPGANSNLEPSDFQLTDSDPVTLEIKLQTRQLLVWQTGSCIFTLPYNIIAEHLIPTVGQVIELQQQRFLLWRQQIIPIYKLSKLLTYNYPLSESSYTKAREKASYQTNLPLPMLIVSHGERTIALEPAIDRLIAEPELSIKTFDRAIAHPSYLYGCTVLENNSLLLAIDTVALLDRTSELEQTTIWDGLEQPLKDKPFQSGVKVTLPSISLDRAPTFLIVDDSDTWRYTVSSTLKKAGYQVLSAEDGQEGIKKLQENPQIQGIISDIEMPNLNGFEFLSHRLHNPQLAKIPVVMLSSCNSNKHRDLAKQLGATAYLTKPYNEQEFLSTLRKCLGK